MRKTVGGEPIFSPILYYSSRRSLASLSLLPRSFYREAPSTPSFPPPRSIAKAPHAKCREAAGDKLEPNQPTLKESPPSNRRSAGGETTPPLKARKQAIPLQQERKGTRSKVFRSHSEHAHCTPLRGGHFGKGRACHNGGRLQGKLRFYSGGAENQPPC